MGILIVSNNKKLVDGYGGTCAAVYVDGGYLDVLLEVRSRVHAGYKLLSHPMAGSLKPNQTPFRSVILECRVGGVDVESLQLLENSILAAEKFLSRKKTPQWNDRILDDFRTIDASLMAFTLQKCGINV